MNDRIEIPPAIPRWPNRLLRAIGWLVLHLFGWRVDVRFPDAPKFIVIAAPHTSNWDFVFGMAAILLLQVRVHWIAKHTLFKGLQGRFFRALGGIPVDRSAHGGVVQETVRAFSKAERLIVAIAPEGTRSRREQWKRGFYHIALGAQVPVLVAYIDYARKQIGTDVLFWPSGDWAQDMKPVFRFYEGIEPKHPGNFAIER